MQCLSAFLQDSKWTPQHFLLKHNLRIKTACILNRRTLKTPLSTPCAKLKVTFCYSCDWKLYYQSQYIGQFKSSPIHYEKKLTKNIRPTDIFQMYTKYLVNVLKCTKHLVNVHKFHKYLVNSYHQKDVKHYVLTN